MKRKLWTALVVVGAVLSGAAAWADSCDRCGDQAACHRICRVVCEYKKVKVTRWECKVEQICLPRRGKHCGHHGHCSCQPVPPQPGRVRCRKRLIRVEETKLVPSYRLVVEYLCSQCAASCQGGSSSAPPPAPPEPKSAQRGFVRPK